MPVNGASNESGIIFNFIFENLGRVGSGKQDILLGWPVYFKLKLGRIITFLWINNLLRALADLSSEILTLLLEDFAKQLCSRHLFAPFPTVNTRMMQRANQSTTLQPNEPIGEEYLTHMVQNPLGLGGFIGAAFQKIFIHLGKTNKSVTALYKKREKI